MPLKEKAAAEIVLLHQGHHDHSIMAIAWPLPLWPGQQDST